MGEPDSEASSAAAGHAAPGRNRDYSAGIGLFVVVFVVMGGAMLAAAQLHLGASIMIAGFTAIFFSIGVGGGALRADLRKVAWYGPLTALSASLPRVLAGYDHWLGLALVCVIIFVAGLLPALGSNYAQAGLGLGIATLLAFALQAPTGTPAQTVAAAFVGVAFVVVLRVLMKVRDPSDVTRTLVAATLTDHDPDFGQAYAMWLRDKPVRWLGQCLHAAVGYRTIRAALTPEEAATADGCARRVHALVTPRKPADPEPGTHDPTAAPLTGSDALSHALLALRHVENAACERNVTVAHGARATRRALALASLRSVMTWRSQILRHAIRTTVGVLITFLIAWTAVGPRDPLVTSMATASFAILQISWTQSLLKAKQRLVGVAGGAALMALALWILPQQWLLPFALLAAAAGLWFIASSQVLSIGSFVIVSVGMNAVNRGLNPTHTLIEYVLLLFTAVALGLLLGFVVIPHMQPDRIDQRVLRARQAVAELLRKLGALSATGRYAPEGGHHVVPHALMRSLQRVLTETANLRSPLGPADEHAGPDAADCSILATQFETLAIIGTLEADQGRLSAHVLAQAADTLDHPRGQDNQSEGRDADAPDFQRLAHWVTTRSTDLLRT